MACNTFIKIKQFFCNKMLSSGLKVCMLYIYYPLYGIEAVVSAIMRKLEVFKMLLYTRILRIAYIDNITAKKVLQKFMEEIELTTKTKISIPGPCYKTE